MTMKYVHTNIIAKDWKKLSKFYQEVFNCVPVPPERNLRGAWLDKMTGIVGAHITGEHLCLPGYEADHPTLEIFSYDRMVDGGKPLINRTGFGHIAFEVDNVQETLNNLLVAGGEKVGELISTDYPNNIKATIIYATDIEGNIIELQCWEKYE